MQEQRAFFKNFRAYSGTSPYANGLMLGNAVRLKTIVVQQYHNIVCFSVNHADYGVAECCHINIVSTI